MDMAHAMVVKGAKLCLHVWTTHLACDFILGGGVCHDELTLLQKVTKTKKNNNNSQFRKYFQKYFLMLEVSGLPLNS